MPEIAQYEILRACRLSGQISTLEIVQRMESDPHFAAWMQDQASATESAR